jgi:myosin heavy subunit
LAYGTTKTNGSFESYESSSNSNVKYVRPAGSSNKSSTTSQSRAQATVSTYFRYSLMDLLSKMVAGAPHFVRCIRPNKDKIPGYFDSEIVQTQLRYTGVLETTKIRRLGYSHRISYGDFVKRYSILINPLKSSLPLTKESCVDILKKVGLRNWKIGKTKIFLKYYHIEHLSRIYEDICGKIVLIQGHIRGWLARRMFIKQKENYTKAALTIQKYFRKYKAKKQKNLCITRNRAIIRLQSHVRAYLARQKYKCQLIRKKQIEKMIKSIVIIQSMWRGYSARKNYNLFKMDKYAKTMQLNYFNQQVQLLANDVYMWMIKSNYRVDPKDLQTMNNRSFINHSHSGISMNREASASKSSTNFSINEDIVNKIKKSLEQKANMINNNKLNEKSNLNQNKQTSMRTNNTNNSPQKTSASSINSTNISHQRGFLINPIANTYDSLIACHSNSNQYQQRIPNKPLSRSNSNLNTTNGTAITSSLGTSSIVAVNLAVLNQNVQSNGYHIDESRIERKLSISNSNEMNVVCELFNSKNKYHSPIERYFLFLLSLKKKKNLII